MNYDNTLKGHKNEQAIREVLSGWTEHTDHVDFSNSAMESGTDRTNVHSDYDHGIYFVEREARWCSSQMPADDVIGGLWADDEKPSYIGSYVAGFIGPVQPHGPFNAVKQAAHEAKQARKRERDAAPYLYNKAGTKPKYDGRQSANAMKHARTRMSQYVAEQQAPEPVPTQHAEARRDDMAVQPRKHTLRDAQTGVLALTGWECAPVSFEGMGEQVYVSGHDKAALVTQLANEVRGAVGDGQGLEWQPCTPAASWESPVAHWNDDDAAACIAAYLERTEA